MNDRRSYLIQQKALGLISPSEQAELAAMPNVIYNENGAPGMVLPPPLQGDSHDERLADFARRYQFENREATDAEVAAFVSGKRPDAYHDHQSPVADAGNDPWENDVEPTPSVADQPTPQPATPPQAPVAERRAPDAPQQATANDAPADQIRRLLGDAYELVEVLPGGKRVVCLWLDPANPRQGKRPVTIDLARERKKRAQTARAATRMRGPANDTGRQLKF
jgi:hypothetical protein